MKRKRKAMWIAISSVVLVIVGVAAYLGLPHSPCRKQFERAVSQGAASAAAVCGVFTEEDIAGLPLPVQKYFRYCGYLGTPKTAYMKVSFSDVDFMMSKDRTIRIDYEQFNLAERPVRYALISSSLFGIPFEGLDSYEDGTGSMKGMLAKVIPLFDQRGEEMDRACLVTWLAECPVLPSAMLQDFVTWEEVDGTHAKATLSYKGVTAGGIFTFSESGELLSFRTSDRTAIDMDGTKTEADWSALYLDYRPANGVLQPSVLQSVWHYPEGDCVYFNQNRSPVKIQYDQIKTAAGN